MLVLITLLGYLKSALFVILAFLAWPGESQPSGQGRPGEPQPGQVKGALSPNKFSGLAREYKQV